MNPFITILLSVLVFGFLIFVHEFGHYIFARIFKVTIIEFSIGMGPRLLTYKSKKTGIVYSIAAIPFGGYVAMAGEDGVYPEEDPQKSGEAEQAEADRQFADPALYGSATEKRTSENDPNGFDKKPAWQRFIITVAGAFVNLVVGFLVLVIFTSISKIGGTTVSQVYQIKDEPQYEYITSDDLIEAGDRIVAVDGKRVSISDELVYEVMRRGYEPVDVTVVRDGKELVIPNVQFPTATESGQSFGSINFSVKETPKSVGVVLGYSFEKGILMIRMCWESLYDLITGRYGFEAVSGPVGISGAIGEAANNGIAPLLYLVALISINLGIMNMLPIPALDGGRTLTILIEMISGKRMPQKVERTINGVGLALLLGFSVVVLVKDVIGLIF